MKLSNETSPIRKFFNFIRDDMQIDNFCGDTFENQELVDSFKRYIRTLLIDDTLKPQTKTTYVKELKCFIKWCLENKEIVDYVEKENIAKAIINTSIPDFINFDPKDNYEDREIEFSEEYSYDNHYNHNNSYHTSPSSEKGDEEDQTEDAKDESAENVQEDVEINDHPIDIAKHQNALESDKKYPNLQQSIPHKKNNHPLPIEQSDHLVVKRENISKRNSHSNNSSSIDHHSVQERKRKNESETTVDQEIDDESDSNPKKIRSEDSSKLINQEIYLLKESYQKSLDIISILEKKNFLIEQKLQQQQTEIELMKEQFKKEIENLKQINNEKKNN